MNRHKVRILATICLFSLSTNWLAAGMVDMPIQEKPAESARVTWLDDTSMASIVGGDSFIDDVEKVHETLNAVLCAIKALGGVIDLLGKIIEGIGDLLHGLFGGNDSKQVKLKVEVGSEGEEWDALLSSDCGECYQGTPNVTVLSYGVEEASCPATLTDVTRTIYVSGPYDDSYCAS